MSSHSWPSIAPTSRGSADNPAVGDMRIDFGYYLRIDGDRVMVQVRLPRSRVAPARRGIGRRLRAVAVPDAGATRRRTRISFRSQEKKSSRPQLLLSSTKRGSQVWGRGSLAVCFGDHAAVSARRSNRRLHPTRIGTRTATTPKGQAMGGNGYPPVPMLLRSRAPGHSSRLAHPAKGCPVCGGSGAGQTSRSRTPPASPREPPPVARGRGACERGT